MAVKQKKIVDQAMVNPEKVYCTPEEVLSDSGLSQEDKLRILDSWAVDECAMSRAEGENMTPKEAPETAPEELLQRIEKAKLVLEKGAAVKLGG